MEEDSTLKPLQDALTKSLVELTRTSAQLAAEDLNFFRVSYPKQAKQLDRSSAKILQLSRKLLQSAAAGTNIHVPPISGADSLDDEWSSVVEVVDNLLEKTDVALDEFTGVIKKQGLEDEAQQAPHTIRTPYRNRSAIPKPQLLFNTPPQYQSNSAFKPLLRTKPHAKVPLEQCLSSSPSADQQEQYDMKFYLCLRDQSPLKKLVDKAFRFKQPYQEEIEQYQYPPKVRSWHEPVPSQPFAETTAMFVDTPEAVGEMLAELKAAKEIAVDLEHHDKHSYIGIVSLMQISTRDKDWIVDTLKPWREDLQALNEVFADPSILKVFHGASMDIIWLQRDLGLYVVGLFDTYHASNCLNYPRHSLAFLLDKFTGVKAQKQYQMADWRIRPLSPQLLEYARSDTHYLLYIYDQMRNELVEASKQLSSQENLVDVVLERSKQECLQKFDFRQYDAERGTGPDGWFQLLIRTPALFTKQQFAVFRAVHQWRDEVARKEDESINFVMQKQTLFNIARHLPTTLTALHSCAHPMSELMRERAEELLAVVQKGTAAGEEGPDMKTFLDEHPETIRYNAAKAERARARMQHHDPDLSVGEIMQRERSKMDRGEQVPLEQVQSQTSAFWGSTIPPNGHLHGPSDSPMLEVPLPPNITAADSATVEVEKAEISTPAITDNASNPHPETFVLRETKKRKSKRPAAEASATATPADPMLSDTIALAGSYAESDAERDARRARKATRRAEKARQAADKAAAQRAAEDETPFDYAAAPSVLDAKPTPKKGVNPYMKAMDTSKGARKMRHEPAGKSATFSGGGGGAGGGKKQKKKKKG